MLGMGLPVPLLSLVGLAAILALQVSDPSAWMVKLGGSLYGVIALIFVIAANLGTAIAGYRYRYRPAASAGLVQAALGT